MQCLHASASIRSRSIAGAAMALVLALGLLAVTPGADARTSRKKSMWGPTRVNGVSQFPIYRHLGVGIYQMTVRWNEVAPTRPSRAKDPRDPAYRWPAEVDYAIREGRRYGITLSVLLIGAPPWANGGRAARWAPRQPADFARFSYAASRRYRAVRHWMIWGEPSRRHNFMPLDHERRGRRLSRRQSRGPRLYARILDSSYVGLKRANRRNIVIGGNTFTTGDVSPHNFIRSMRLPGGRPPRMDLYGHNPFTARRPDLRKRPLGNGFADFSDLDTLARWTDRYLKRRGQRRLRLFLSEFFLPTDHFNHEFNFYVSRRTQASWLGSALRIVRRWRRIYTFGWHKLYDDPPRPRGDEVNRGLIDRQGRKKPAYWTFRRG
jgi:hypothetical protein